MLMKKLRSSRGETLTEILAAILVCGFSILLLVGMMTTSMSINRKVRALDAGADGSGGFYGALSEVETHKFTGADDGCTVTLSGTGLATITVSDVYSCTQEGLTAYGKEVVGP